MMKVLTSILLLVWAVAIWRYILTDNPFMWGAGLIFLSLAACLDGFSLHPKSPKLLIGFAYLCLFLGLMNRLPWGASRARSYVLSHDTEVIVTLFYVLSVLLMVIVPGFSRIALPSAQDELRKLREAAVTALAVGPALSLGVSFGVVLFLYLARDSVAAGVGAFPFALAFAALFSVFIYVSLRITVKHSGRYRKFRLYLVGVLLLGALVEYSTRANWIIFGLTLVACVFGYSIFELMSSAVPARNSESALTK